VAAIPQPMINKLGITLQGNDRNSRIQKCHKNPRDSLVPQTMIEVQFSGSSEMPLTRISEKSSLNYRNKTRASILCMWFQERVRVPA